MTGYERLEVQNFIKKEKLSQFPLNGEQFKVGDKVTFTNDYGVSFSDLRVVGFSNEIYPNSGTIYLDYDCYWFPTKPKTIKLDESISLTTN